MNVSIFDYLQLIGGLILSLGYIPQIIQLVKSKMSRDLNLKTLFFIFLGVSLMEVYAINLVVNGSGHMFLVTNTMATILALTMYLLALKYKEKSK